MAYQQKPDKRVEIQEKTTQYQGFFQVDRYKLKHQKYEGGWSPVLVRELFERGHTVAVLPYDAVRDSVVLVEQFRIGAYAAGGEAWLSEAIAGIIDVGEKAEKIAYREALEDLAEGRTVSAYAAIPLLWLQFNKASLQAQWT